MPKPIYELSYIELIQFYSMLVNKQTDIKLTKNNLGTCEHQEGCEMTNLNVFESTATLTATGFILLIGDLV